MPRDIDQVTLRRMREVLDLAEITVADYSEFDLWDQTIVTRRMLTAGEKGRLRDQAKGRLKQRQGPSVNDRRPS